MLTFIQTKLFSRLFSERYSDDDLAELERRLAANPEAGDLVVGSGGVRKMRWGAPGRGKRGGVRIIYYLKLRRGQVWLLTLYAKNQTDSIPGHVLRQIKEEIDAES
ncbi:MAG: type II toxin-antitoxin system RelE/ParE family toxin [Burkholderiales bacterium]|nr:type II toxin-antitoxin system RelE/ParE family toxin [Burkholderiales bacterium]